MKFVKVFIAFSLFIAVSILVMIVIAKPGNDLACGAFGYLNSRIMKSNEIEVSPSIKDEISIEFMHSKAWLNVFENGRETNQIPYRHGLNTLRVFHNDKIILTIEHVKFNNWHSHKYQIYKGGEDISYKIQGCDNTPMSTDA